MFETWRFSGKYLLNLVAILIRMPEVQRNEGESSMELAYQKNIIEIISIKTRLQAHTEKQTLGAGLYTFIAGIVKICWKYVMYFYYTFGENY